MKIFILKMHTMNDIGCNHRKSSIKPSGGLLFSSAFEEEFNRDGGLDMERGGYLISPNSCSVVIIKIKN